MTEKKTIKNYKLALIHFGIAYVAIPLVFVIILSPILYIFGARPSNIDPVLQHWRYYGFDIALTIFLTWFGVFISSRYLLKNYNILNSKKVINLATAYVVVTLFLLNFGVMILRQIGGADLFVYTLIHTAIQVGIFFSFSAKYLSSSDILL